jgi:hypothetical protein
MGIYLAKARRTDYRRWINLRFGLLLFCITGAFPAIFELWLLRPPAGS